MLHSKEPHSDDIRILQLLKERPSPDCFARLTDVTDALRIERCDREQLDTLMPFEESVQEVHVCTMVSFCVDGYAPESSEGRESQNEV